MPKIRTTMRPDQEIEISDAEYIDLQRQGLLVEEDAHADVPPATAAPATPTTPKKSGTGTSKES